jgi:hypothetical protein
MPEYRNRIGCNVSGTPGTGTITLGAALSGHQAFTTFGANKVVDILIEEGTNWEICRDCTFTNGTNTVTRGTLEESSSGSRVSFTSAAKVYLTQTAQRVGYAADFGTISGFQVSRASDTSVNVGGGYIYIQGKRYSKTGNTVVTLDGTTALSGSTLANDSLIFIYAYISGGNLAYGWQRYNGDYTAQESFDGLGWTTYDLGNAYRFIGCVRTAAASTALMLGYCISENKSNTRRFMYREPYTMLTVTGSTAGNVYTFAHFPYSTTRAFLNIGVGDTTSAGVAKGAVSNQSVVDTNSVFNALVSLYTPAANTTMYSGISALPVEPYGNIYAEAATATNYITVLNAGFEYEV